MIQSFADKVTADLFYGAPAARLRRLPPDVLRAARKKLDQLHAALRLDDLRLPPSNHLEALRGDRKGYHSIRVNDQWRLVFRWKGEGPEAVEFTDYH